MSTVASEVQVQRQHPRFKLPLMVTIKDRKFMAADWSVGGIALQNADQALKVGEPVELTMSFNLQGYSLSLKMNGIVRYNRRDIGRCGIEFTDVTQRQLTLIRFMIDSYISGQLVDAGDVLEFMSRDNSAKARKKELEKAANDDGSPSLLAIVRRVLGFTLTFGLALLALAYLGVSAFNRIFVFDAKSATVESELVSLPAPSSGFVTSFADKTSFKAGEPVYVFVDIQTNEPTTIFSPCSCDVVGEIPAEGDYVARGQSPVKFFDSFAPSFVKAKVSFDDVSRLGSGTSTLISFMDGSEVKLSSLPEQVLQNIVNPEVLDDNVYLRIPVERDISASDIGLPVRVRFNTFSLPEL
ncbi:PilZ domain-containing protein [Stappia sp. BW2]|jgi:alginate biosynthesis protein Alg44|uniref:PilZ domain-containing protein n=1 Tax=Stappia sp. BW2 TaxID=2592622 RepID=UPI0011DED598|nr:PilZ domain-containing protein [Stappia sp. BW2]TYC64034.1 PilZ domain-containing protein [Stappia sp. BW2]